MDTSGSGERQALLEVVEVNPFRHLSHIALRMAAASDADLKLYLAKTIKTLKVRWDVRWAGEYGTTFVDNRW